MQLLINLNKTWFGVHPIAEMTTVLSSHSVKAHTNTAFLTSIHKSSNQKLTYGSHHTQFKSIRMELPFQKKMASYIFTRTLSTRSFTKKKTSAVFLMLFIISYCMLSLHIITFPQGYVGALKSNINKTKHQILIKHKFV